MSRELSYSKAMSNLGTETAFEILAMAKELEKKGAKVIHLEIGEPDFDTPEYIKEAAVKALKAGYTHYTPAPGILELRQAISEKVSKERGIDVDPNREVIVMPGAKPGLFTGILSTVNPGEEVLVPDPGFPIYRSVVEFIGAVAVSIPLKEEKNFRMDPEDVRRKVTAKTKMLILNSPHNPCGSALLKSDIEALAEIARDNNFWVMSDEVYSKIIYEGSHHSITSEPGMKERTILIDGFSKTYAMTGWRLGYAIGPPQVIAHMVKLQINIASCPAAFTQMAAIEALKGPQDATRKMVQEFDRRRRTIVSGLNSIKGMSCNMPGGAFYVFPNVKRLGMNSRDIMMKLLNQGHVATLHGDAFGPAGAGYLRLSYATSLENIKEALTRIKQIVEEL
jgi:aspartate/methionine/tyrosine aminotransferase